MLDMKSAKERSEASGNAGEGDGVEPPFVKMYIEDICSVEKVFGARAHIFHFMIMNMNFKNQVSYGPTAKKEFLNKHGYTNQTFNNNVKGLIEKGFIERLSRGEFLVNKKYVTKVPWDKVRHIRMITDYSMDGKKTKTVCRDRDGNELGEFKND